MFLHASPVRFLIWCKFLAGVARAAKEIRAVQIFIALIKHLFCDISRARLVIHKIVFVPKGSLTLEGFVFPIQISWWNSTGPLFLWIVIFSTSYIRINYSTRKKCPRGYRVGCGQNKKFQKGVVFLTVITNPCQEITCCIHIPLGQLICLWPQTLGIKTNSRSSPSHFPKGSS